MRIEARDRVAVLTLECASPRATFVGTRVFSQRQAHTESLTWPDAKQPTATSGGTVAAADSSHTGQLRHSPCDSQHARRFGCRHLALPTCHRQRKHFLVSAVASLHPLRTGHGQQQAQWENERRDSCRTTAHWSLATRVNPVYPGTRVSAADATAAAIRCAVSSTACRICSFCSYTGPLAL